MSKRNGKRKTENIHNNVLRPSTNLMRVTIVHLHERFVQLADLYLRSRGFALSVPKEMQSDLVLWRTMAMRHQQRDYRNTGDEWLAVKRIAQWTVSEKMKLCNQPDKVVQWEDE